MAKTRVRIHREAPWLDDDLDKLRSVYPHTFQEEHHLIFPNRTPGAVKQKALKLGITRKGRQIYAPRKYDNCSDGNYISGLIDGEGWFMASIAEKSGRRNYNPKFGVSLRVDDKEILLWMKEYFGCGTVYEVERKSPMACFVVANLYDIMSKIVPHFEAFPLRAKKKNDYAVWREMVNQQAAYFKRHWPEEVRDRMRSLYAQLKETRKLQSRP